MMLPVPPVVTIPAGVTRVDGRGKYLMPGLADMHVHTWFQADLPLFLAAGVTTVRNMAGSPMHLEWRTKIVTGLTNEAEIVQHETESWNQR